MSVINRMLKDLDQRQHRPADEQYTPAAIAPEPVRWWLWLSLSAAVVVIAGGSWWWLAQPQGTEVQVVEQQVVRQPVTEQPIQKEQPAAEQQVDDALTAQELAALELAAQQQAAQEQAAQELAAQEQAAQELAAKEQAAQELAAQQQAAKEQAAKELAAKEQADKLAAEQLAAKQTTQPQVPLYQQEQQTPPPQTEQKQVDSSFAIERVQLTPAELAESNLAKARTAFRQGEREKAQDLLEKALIVMPEHIAVRSELAAYWYGRGMTTRALSLLRQGLDIRPQQSQWQLLYARIVERSGRIQDAYDALLNVQADTEDALELMQLRASSANQLGLFAEAAADYTELATRLNQGRWWIAAAVAYEDANNINAALQAYRQALTFADLNTDAVNYAGQRIRALGGQ